MIMMIFDLDVLYLQTIINGGHVDKPVLQVLSTKKISAQGSSSDRYRLLLSDGIVSYSHAMLATQLNSLMESNEMDNLCIVRIEKYLCNTIQGDRRVMIVLDVSVLHRGEQVGSRIGNPQQYKPGSVDQNENKTPAQLPPEIPKQESGQSFIGTVADKQQKPNTNNPYQQKASNMGGGSNYTMKPSAGSGTPGGSTKVHSIASLTPYQNRWRIRARVTQKSNVRTWSNSRGEGKLFSITLTDESGEIRATGFNESVDKYYEMLEVNKIYYVSKASLKIANKQYNTVQNEYEMTFNPDTMIDPCDEDVDLPSVQFDFVKINELESKTPNSMIDLIGVVESCAEVSTVTGRQSGKEITKRDLQLVDQTGFVVNCTLWGTDAQSFNGSGNPVLAVKGAKLSDYGGRSVSVLAQSQMIVNPDVREAHMLRGWYDHDGKGMKFNSFQSEGGGARSGSTNWKTFAEMKSENVGADKAEYFTSKATIMYLKKENCMYQACPTEQCNKKVVDQGNGMYRCEKCNREFPNFKYRMMLSANLGDFSDNQWITCFHDSAEMVLGRNAEELGSLRESNESEFDQVFQEALFKSYVFQLRAKVETYNEESRLKTVCLNVAPVDFVEQGKRLAEEIKKLSAS
ncbi:hypothetical protein FSP39_018496 [Pinctada imbricata]|uniref:Replication protein A subunit n=1 Tax=Pinctada imbricata TaxID=66713 RepID=A0AA88XG48_PINIB|nr:hypothetical protein FSP39_018496 [Pinctada imbricata]